MRTLKKTLCLVLALVMVLGLCAFNASAAYADADKITYTEAVDVMSAIKVIQGDESGFRPTDTLTRAEAATIITKMMGYGDLKGTTDFTDCKGHWGESYIAFCVKEGIVAGYGDGTFGPNDTLTGSQWAKMLLCALGYVPENEGISGSDWEIAVAKLVKSTGLSAGIAGFDGTKPIVREAAAQMALTTLQTTMVEYANGGVNITIGGATINTGASKAEAQKWAGTEGVNYTTGADSIADETIQFCEVYFPTLAWDQAPVNGLAGHTWTLKGEDVSDFVATGVVLKTINSTGLTEAQLNTKTSAYYAGITADDNPAVTYVTNGSTGTANDLEKKGVVVEFIDEDSDGKYDKVSVTDKTVAILTAAPTVVTKSGKTYVTIAQAGVANKLSTLVTGFEGLARGDVILYVNMADGTTIIEKAESFTGSVTGHKAGVGGGDVIGGKYYSASELTGTSYTVNTIKDPTEEYTFYTDDAGFIVAAVLASEAATVNYAAVRDVVWVKPVTDGSIGSVSKSYAQAKLVFPDGTSEVVTVSSLDGYKIVVAGAGIDALVTGSDDSHYVTGTVSTTVTGNSAVGKTCTAISGDTTGGNFYTIFKAASTTIAATDKVLGKFLAITDTSSATGTTNVRDAIPQNAFYAYTVNADGSYALSTTMKTGESRAALADHAIANNTVAFDGTNKAGSNTVFIYVTADALGQDVYTVYTGIKAAPSTGSTVPSNKDGYAVIQNSTSGIASYVFVVTTAIQNDSTDIVYLLSTSYTTINGKTPYYIYDAVVNGEVTTVKADASGLSVGFNTVDKVVDGVYTLNNSINGSVKTGIKGVAGNVLVTGSASYKYADGTPAFIIQKVGTEWTSTSTTVDALALDATDKLLVIPDAAGTSATTVYVVKVDEAPATLTLAAGSSNGVTSVSHSGALHGADAVEVAGTKTTNDKAKLTWTAADDTSIVTVTVNGVEVTSGADFVVKNGANTVVVTVKDSFSNALTVYTYTFTAAIATA